MPPSPPLRFAAVVAVSASLVACAGVAPALAEPATPRPRAAPTQATFHGNAAHTGVYEADGPRTLKGLRWSFATKGRVMSSPAIANGALYVGSDDGKLYALDAKTGAQRWVYATKGPVRSSPAVAAGIVYINSQDGFVHAVDATTGTARWTFGHPGERRFEAKGMHGMAPKSQTMPDPFDHYLSSPVVSAGTVFVGSGDGRVYALDAGTGAETWRFQTGDVVHSSPAVENGTVFVGSWDSHLYALDEKTGRERWRFKTGEDQETFNQVGIQSSPAVSGGIVYVGCRDGHLYAVDAATGAPKWDLPTQGSWVIGTPAIDAGSIYVGTSDSKLFFGLDAKTGQKRFETKMKALVFSSAALSRGIAYVGSFDGRLYALDSQSGAILWSFATEGAVKDERKVLLPDGTVDPKLFTSPYYLDVVASVDRMLSAGAVLSSPVVSDGAVFFGSADGRVYAVE
jgi:outer membrane protein assembly factor BamB